MTGFTQSTLFGASVVPAIVGLVQVAKDAGLPVRFAPVAAVLFGLLAGIAEIGAARYPWVPGCALGVAFGLAACGLYDAARPLIPAGQGDTTAPPPVAPAPDGPA